MRSRLRGSDMRSAVQESSAICRNRMRGNSYIKGPCGGTNNGTSRTPFEVRGSSGFTVLRSPHVVVCGSGGDSDRRRAACGIGALTDGADRKRAPSSCLVGRRDRPDRGGGGGGIVGGPLGRPRPPTRLWSRRPRGSGKHRHGRSIAGRRSPPAPRPNGERGTVHQGWRSAHRLSATWLRPDRR